MIPGWGRSSCAVPGRTPKLGRSSASVITWRRAWCSGGQEAGHEVGPAQLKHARIPIFYTPEKLAEATEPCSVYSYMVSIAWPMALPLPRRARRRRMRPSPSSGLGRPTLSESESKQLLAAWGVRVRVSTGVILIGRRSDRRARVSGGSQGRFARIPHRRQRPGRLADSCAAKLNLGLRGDLGQCQGLFKCPPPRWGRVGRG